MDVEIVKQNGHKFRLSEYGVVQDFVVHSIGRTVVRDQIDGRAGSADYGVEIGDRSIEVPMILKAADLHDYAHLRDELYSLLGDSEPFYIREMRRPKSLQYGFVDFGQKPKWEAQTDNEYVNGKQYQVRLNNTLTPDQRSLSGEVSIEFVTSGLPYAESVYTTLELHDTGYSATAEKYGLVDNIDVEKVKYRFTESSFTVYNAGNVTVEPESMFLNIRLRNMSSFGNMKIRNKTTGEEHIYYPEFAAKRHYYIDGLNVTSASFQVFRNTNRKFISLAPGSNEFEISGCTFDSVWLDFKYYYK